MCARGHGVIITIAGLAGERPDAHYIAGSVANAALIMFSRSLGGDSIRYGVRVLVVNPGPVETDALIAHSSRLAKERFGDESRWREIMHRVPMKRAATTAEVAAMVTFLASDRCAYVSGSSILIDGGLLSDAALGVRRA
jgi:NAD(P)-dependent dehydrogenase (short-subunit alcohol dehydrogenase family)